MLLIFSTREPLGRLLSMYSYLVWGANRPFMMSASADIREMARHFKAKETELKKLGVEPSEVLGTLLVMNDSFALQMARATQFGYVRPVACARTDCDKSTWLRPCAPPEALGEKATSYDARRAVATALRNLLRIDIVVTTEDMNGLLDQLRFMVPSFKHDAKVARLWPGQLNHMHTVQCQGSF